MAKNGKNGSDEKNTQTIDGATGKLDPTPRPIKLSDLRDVRLEMAYVYRQMDAGKLEAQEGTRRVYVLDRIKDVIELAEFEKRIAELERSAGLTDSFNGERASPMLPQALPEKQLN
jgi:hypothetical protein